MSMIQDIKSLTLAAFIIIGVLVVHARANAGELEALTASGQCLWSVTADFERVPDIAGG